MTTIHLPMKNTFVRSDRRLQTLEEMETFLKTSNPDLCSQPHMFVHAENGWKQVSINTIPNEVRLVMLSDPDSSPSVNLTTLKDNDEFKQRLRQLSGPWNKVYYFLTNAEFQTQFIQLLESFLAKLDEKNDQDIFIFRHCVEKLLKILVHTDHLFKNATIPYLDFITKWAFEVVSRVDMLTPGPQHVDDLKKVAPHLLRHVSHAIYDDS